MEKDGEVPEPPLGAGAARERGVARPRSPGTDPVGDAVGGKWIAVPVEEAAAGRAREVDEAKKKSYITKYLPQIGVALQDILQLTDRQRDDDVVKLKDILERSRKI